MPLCICVRVCVCEAHLYCSYLLLTVSQMKSEFAKIVHWYVGRSPTHTFSSSDFGHPSFLFYLFIFGCGFQTLLHMLIDNKCIVEKERSFFQFRLWPSIFVFYFIYLFLAALGLCCCTWAFSSCGRRGLLFVAVRGPLIAVASLVAEHRL